MNHVTKKKINKYLFDSRSLWTDQILNKLYEWRLIYSELMKIYFPWHLDMGSDRISHIKEFLLMKTTMRYH